MFAWCGDCLGTFIINGNHVQGSWGRLQLQDFFRTFTVIEDALFKVKHITMSNQKSQPRITGVDRWSTATNLHSAEKFLKPIATVTTPQGVISPPSVTNLTVCVGSICVW